MKILNVDYQIGKYSVEVNNCIDYNIAGISSYYEKDFFELYCSFWGLFSNFLSYNQNCVRLKILNLFGLSLQNHQILDSDNLISIIQEKIDLENPIIINVPNSVLFYSIMYKNPNIKRVNHSFIINGYDDSKKIFYIRENSINTSVLSTLTPSQPFSEYYLTYDMLMDIYIQTINVLDDKKEIDSFFQFMTFKKNVDIHEIILKFINCCITFFISNKDLLCTEITKILNTKKYDSLYFNEQFRRTTIHSFKPTFDVIKKILPFEYISDFMKLTNDYLRFREKIVNTLAKYALKGIKINDNYLKKILIDLNSYNKKIGLFCKKNIHKKNMYYNKNKVIYENIIVTADSEYTNVSKTFFANNVLFEQKVNNNLNFWMSNAETKRHWIKFYFNKKVHINKIIIEHRANIKHITKDYKLLISQDGAKWVSIINVKNNNEVHTEYNFKTKLNFVFFKIIIEKPNNGIDNFARISRVSFLSENC